MEQKKTNDYGTGASEVRPSVNRAVARAKKAEVKKEIAEKKAAEKKATAQKKAAGKKELADRKAAEKSAKAKKPAKKPTNVVLQYGGQSVSYRTIVTRAKKVWQEEHKGKAGELYALDLYLKPEEGRAYYVMNGEIAGDFPL